MPTDFFGCLHTEEVRGHKVRVFNPFLKKNIYLRMHRKTRTYFRWVPRAGGPKVLLFFLIMQIFLIEKNIVVNQKRGGTTFRSNVYCLLVAREQAPSA